MVVEEDVRKLRDCGDLRAAATRAIEGYGPEVLGFLLALTGNPDDADDAFAQAAADLWQHLDRFEGRSTVRVWFYALARNAASHIFRSPACRRRVGLDDVSEIVARVRTATPAYMQSTVKDAIAEIRMGLDPDDRMLLVLRVDRQMSWNDVARVFLEREAASADDDVARVAARLRKRFQSVKDDIRERARAAGLLGT